MGRADFMCGSRREGVPDKAGELPGTLAGQPPPIWHNACLRLRVGSGARHRPHRGWQHARLLAHVCLFRPARISHPASASVGASASCTMSPPAAV